MLKSTPAGQSHTDYLPFLSWRPLSVFYVTNLQPDSSTRASNNTAPWMGPSPPLQSDFQEAELSTPCMCSVECTRCGAEGFAAETGWAPWAGAAAPQRERQHDRQRLHPSQLPSDFQEPPSHDRHKTPHKQKESLKAYLFQLCLCQS